MAEIRKIVRSNPLSNFRQSAPVGGAGFAAIAEMAQGAYDFLAPIAEEELAQRGDEDARANQRRVLGENRVPTAPQVPAPAAAAPAAPDEPPTTAFSAPPAVTTSLLQGMVDRQEGAGDYRTLFGFANRPGGAFAGIDITQMSIGQLVGWASRDGEYGRHQIARLGYLATPMGRYQVVGSTLARAAEEMGLTPDTLFSRSVQDQVFAHLARGRLSGPRSMEGKIAGLRAEWDGFRHVPDAELAAAIEQFEAGDFMPPPASIQNPTYLGEITAPSADLTMDPSLPGDVRAALFPPTPTTPQGPSGYEGLRPAPTTAPAPSIPAPTLIRNDQGQLEARLYSPASDPIFRAYNAAYMAATLSEAGMATRADLMALSQQHADDPEGFMAAARQYSDQTAANTDPRLRRDVRAQMDEEIERRYLGMMDQQYRTTLARAQDGMNAQREMWSQDYAAAIASGNPVEIERTRTQLQSVLAAQEAMPGSTWSPQRSALEMRNAEEQGARQVAQQRAAVADQHRESLRTIIAAREEGLVGADEAILSDPEVWASDPELAQEAAAWIEFRSAFPGFQSLPPAQQQAVIADLRAQPVQDEYQIAMIGKAEEAASAGQRAWAEDPIARAAEVLPTAPPPIPAYDPADPQAMMNALTARAEYANGLVQQGYVARPTFFSRAEADDLSLAMGKDMPDEVRLALAQAVASGLGDNAIFAFDQLDLDPVLGHSGRMLASGGDAATAMEALRGQRMLDEGLVSIPAALTRIDAVAPEISEALSGIPANDVEMLSSITAYAQAIYAANARGVDPDSQQAKDLMAAAIQRAMGQSEDANGRTTGGVQRVLNGSVWLPVGMSGDLVNERLRDMVPPSGLGAGFQDMAEAFNDSRDVRLARWRASQAEGIAPSLPYVGTQPMPANLLRSARLVPVGGENGSVYRMEIVRSGTVLDVVTESGDIFYLDLKRMMEAP
jgi:hypothetical protein